MHKIAGIAAIANEIRFLIGGKAEQVGSRVGALAARNVRAVAVYLFIFVVPLEQSFRSNL